jgi:fructose-1,6-bisphosphatase II / sedoheptulose-1,7-bisphosphatase
MEQAYQSGDRNLAMEMVRVTEAAAIAGARWMGRGDEQSADQAAVEAMHSALSVLAIDATVVIGEGERDEAAQLYVGEKLGAGGPSYDVALDPLEGATITATGGSNAISCLAVATSGTLLPAPDTYMDKIAVGAGLPDRVVNLDADPAENIASLAEARGVDPEDLVVIILDRPRHQDLIARVRTSGARIRLIRDGDVAGAIATTRPDSGFDMYMGSGGAPEGVLAAAALRCVGGQFQGRFVFRNDDEMASARRMGIEDLHKIYTLEELAGGDVMFAATGVTDGTMLRGVHRTRDGALHTHSIVMRSKTRTVRTIEAEHHPRKSEIIPHFGS